MSNNCELVEELRKLKKSSLEAVDSEKEFSDFKQYMHIHRKVEDDLISTIARSSMQRTSQESAWFWYAEMLVMASPILFRI